MSNPIKPEHREKNLMTIGEFAKEKNVTRTGVHYQIKTTKAIIPVLIGKKKHRFIDWNQYKDFEFNDNMKR